MCLTAHYIDSSWNLKINILSFCAFPPPHTGAGIAHKGFGIVIKRMDDREENVYYYGRQYVIK